MKRAVVLGLERRLWALLRGIMALGSAGGRGGGRCFWGRVGVMGSLIVDFSLSKNFQRWEFGALSYVWYRVWYIFFPSSFSFVFFYHTCRFLSGVESDLRSIALSFLFEAPVSNSFPLLLSNDELLSPSTVSIVPSRFMSWVVRPSPISDNPRSVGSVSWFSYAHSQPAPKKNPPNDFRDQLEQLCHLPRSVQHWSRKFLDPIPRSHRRPFSGLEFMAEVHQVASRC